MRLDMPAWVRSESEDAIAEQKNKLAAVIDALNQHQLSKEFADSAASTLAPPLASENSPKAIAKSIKTKRLQLLRLANVQMNLSVPGQYRNQWAPLGMTIFGLPIGLALSTANDNLGLLALGLPIGLSLGMAIGNGMDAKAEQAGRQLKIK